MKPTNRMNRILAAAVTLVAITAANGAFAASEQTASAPASAPDYRIELIGRPQQAGGIGKMHQIDSESLVFVRLVRSSDGAPLTDTDVTLTRVDMAPDGMAEMMARSYIRPDGYPGTYRAEIHPNMAGRWAVTVAARVAGEPEPIDHTLTVALAK